MANTEQSVRIPMESRNERASTVSNNSTLCLSVKKVKAAMQLAVFVMLMVILVMNVFRGAPSEQTAQVLYKMMDMPAIGAMNAYDNTHVHINRTAN